MVRAVAGLICMKCCSSARINSQNLNLHKIYKLQYLNSYQIKYFQGTRGAEVEVWTREFDLAEAFRTNCKSMLWNFCVGHSCLTLFPSPLPPSPLLPPSPTGVGLASEACKIYVYSPKLCSSFSFQFLVSPCLASSSFRLHFLPSFDVPNLCNVEYEFSRFELLKWQDIHQGVKFNQLAGNSLT